MIRKRVKDMRGLRFQIGMLALAAVIAIGYLVYLLFQFLKLATAEIAYHEPDDDEPEDEQEQDEPGLQEKEPEKETEPERPTVNANGSQQREEQHVSGSG